MDQVRVTVEPVWGRTGGMHYPLKVVLSNHHDIRKLAGRSVMHTGLEELIGSEAITPPDIRKLLTISVASPEAAEEVAEALRRLSEEEHLPVEIEASDNSITLSADHDDVGALDYIHHIISSHIDPDLHDLSEQGKFNAEQITIHQQLFMRAASAEGAIAAIEAFEEMATQPPQIVLTHIAEARQEARRLAKERAAFRETRQAGAPALLEVGADIIVPAPLMTLGYSFHLGLRGEKDAIEGVADMINTVFPADARLGWVRKRDDGGEYLEIYFKESDGIRAFLNKLSTQGLQLESGTANPDAATKVQLNPPLAVIMKTVGTLIKDRGK